MGKERRTKQSGPFKNGSLWNYTTRNGGGRGWGRE